MGRPTNTVYMIKDRIKHFFRHRLGVFGFAVVCLWILASVLAPVVSVYSPTRIDFAERFEAPSCSHPFGTDRFGRDVLTRCLWALRLSLLVALGAVSIELLIGTSLGAMSGLIGGWVDGVIQRGLEVLMSIPVMILALVILTIVRPGVAPLMIILGLCGWKQLCRVVRGEVLSIKENEFVMAATAIGVTNARLVTIHILPHLIGLIFVNATIRIGMIVLMEAALSYLGFGIPPPAPTLGGMLADARDIEILQSMPWLWVAPGAILSLLVLSVNFVGDGLRDAFDPRGSER